MVGTDRLARSGGVFSALGENVADVALGAAQALAQALAAALQQALDRLG